jgi:SLT domain-containing protein
MHGKTVNVGVHASGSGGMTFTQKVAASISSGGFSLRSLASGGIIDMGTGPTADDVLVRASKGETIVSAADSKKPFMQAAFSAAGVPGYAAGGIAGVTPFAANAEYNFGRSVESALLRAEFANLKKAVAADAKKKAASAALAGAGGGGYAGPGSGNYTADIQAVLRKFGLPLSLTDNWLRQIQSESGGSLTAVNRTDINAQEGHPSVGLLQLIPSTFHAYAGPYVNTPPLVNFGGGTVSENAMAQIYAAIHYADVVYHGAAMEQIIGHGHGYARGGLIPGFASGGVAGQGAAYLKAWRTRHGGGFGAAWGPVVVNQQIAAMTAAVQRAKALSGARGLSAGQHRFWAASAADETRRLGVLNKELTTERAWRSQLGLNELGLDKEIRAAGNLKSLAGPVRGWKAQLGRDKATVAAISKMLGYSNAYLAAHPAAKPGPVLPKITHTYGGDVANNLGTVLASALGPFTGAARGGLVMDRGGWLRPGWNPPSFNGTGRPEHLVPTGGGGGGDVHLHVHGPVGSQAELERWLTTAIRKGAKTRGGGSVERAYGAR